MDDPIELARRKERLIARAQAQRDAIAAALQDLQRPIPMADRAAAATHFLRAHPVLVAAMVAGLVAFRRRSVLSLVARAVAAWRIWRSVAPWLEGLERGFRRGRAAGER